MESRADRRQQREPRATESFGSSADAALDLLELTDLAWHDCYGEAAPPSHVMEDIFICSEGRLDLLAKAALLAVIDFRDLRMWANSLRG